jgi:hypothetical protein
MLLLGHGQLEAVGKRFFVLADECGQALKQMKSVSNRGRSFPHVGVVVPFCTHPRSPQ